METVRTNCSKCNSSIDWNEYVINFGWCDTCFNEDYELYIESTAGPLDWIDVRYK